MITLRTPEPSDKAAWTELWTAYLAFYNTERGPDVFEWTWNQIHDPSPDMQARIALERDRPIGLVHFLYHNSFWEPEKRCYLNDLYTVPDARGSGAGRAMIKAVYADAKERSASRVYWLTHEDNATARRLYDRIGKVTPFIKYMGTDVS